MECKKCGGEMWDNRQGKRNPKAPDFKCKDKENCDGAVWLTAKNGQPNKAAGNGAATVKNVQGAPIDADRQYRIERQHSQEMALRFLALKAEIAISNKEKADVVTTEVVSSIISWFQRDIAPKKQAAPKPEPKPEPAPEPETEPETEPEYDGGLDL